MQKTTLNYQINVSIRAMKKSTDLVLAIVVVLFFLSFVKIAEEVIGKESVVNYDLVLALWIYSLRSPFFTSLMKVITFAGGAG